MWKVNKQGQGESRTQLDPFPTRATMGNKVHPESIGKPYITDNEKK